MRDRLPDLVEKAELAVASSSGVVSEEDLQPLIDLLKTIRLRMSYPEDVLVAALAGGTGSGKSSLFNAMADADLADVGGVRPTTSEPAAAVPGGVGPGLDGFLDHIGIHRRHYYDGTALCLIDLPDTDSVEVEHRHRVDSILPLVDVVIWVTDPEKYRDARLHHDYLAPLSDYSSQFVVALNQIDRLDHRELDRVMGDLELALGEDGLVESKVVPVAAAPIAGPPIGLVDLADTLDSMSSDAVAQKLVKDLAKTARTLTSGVGRSVDYDERARSAVGEAAMNLEQGDVEGAETTITVFLDDVAGEVGGPTGRRVALLAADVPGHIARIVSELTPEGESRRWFRRRKKPVFDRSEAEQKLGEAITRPARAALARRAVALASIAELAVAIENLGNDSPR